MARKIRLTFLNEGVSVIAEMLEKEAPSTCEAIWNALPVSGESHHAIYSGSEAVLILPEMVRIEPENATADVSTGDVGYAWFLPGSSATVEREFSEICWFYHWDARPSMWEGPAPVSIFARILGDADPFYAVCRRMRREGVKPLSIERVENDDR
jgi:hypothetical protein